MRECMGVCIERMGKGKYEWEVCTSMLKEEERWMNHKRMNEENKRKCEEKRRRGRRGRGREESEQSNKKKQRIDIDGWMTVGFRRT